jgi:hypothetical protein
MKKYLFIFFILFSSCSVLRKSNDTITSNHSNDLAQSFPYNHGNTPFQPKCNLILTPC